MSWAEVKRVINSDLTKPLNTLIVERTGGTSTEPLSHYLWLTDLVAAGGSGYASSSESIVDELIASSPALLTSIDAIIGMIEGANYSHVLADADCMTALAASAYGMGVVAADAALMAKVVTSGLALNKMVKASAAKAALITNQTVLNGVMSAMLSTLNADTTNFTKTASDGNMGSGYSGVSGAYYKIIGTADSFVYVKDMVDGSTINNRNFTHAYHNHDATTEMVHDAFPSGTTSGTVTLNKFAVGGYKVMSYVYDSALSYTCDKYEAN